MIYCDGDNHWPCPMCGSTVKRWGQRLSKRVIVAECRNCGAEHYTIPEEVPDLVEVFEQGAF